MWLENTNSFQSFKNCWGSSFSMLSIWRMFHVHMRKIYILLLMSTVFYRCLSGFTGLYCSTLFPVNLLPSCSIIESEVLKSPTIMVKLSSSHFCQFLLLIFWDFVVRYINIYIVVVMSSWWMGPSFIIICLSLVIFFWFKSIVWYYYNPSRFLLRCGSFLHFFSLFFGFHNLFWPIFKFTNSFFIQFKSTLGPLQWVF